MPLSSWQCHSRSVNNLPSAPSSLGHSLATQESQRSKQEPTPEEVEEGQGKGWTRHPNRSTKNLRARQNCDFGEITMGTNAQSRLPQRRAETEGPFFSVSAPSRSKSHLTVAGSEAGRNKGGIVGGGPVEGVRRKEQILFVDGCLTFTCRQDGQAEGTGVGCSKKDRPASWTPSGMLVFKHFWRRPSSQLPVTNKADAC